MSHTPYHVLLLVAVTAAAIGRSVAEVGTAKNTASMTTANAPGSQFFAVISNAALQCTTVGGRDCAAHSVAGLGTRDGGFVASGTYSIPAATGEDDQDGFVTKISASGELLWVAKVSSLSGSGKYESVLSVAEGPAADNYAIYACGVIHTGTSYDRFVAKFDTATGTRVWLFNMPDSTPTLNGGWEMISVYANGDAVLSGFAEGSPGMVIGEFKSGGNPENCRMNVAILKAEALQRATAPTWADFKLDKTFSKWASGSFTADQALVSGTAVRALDKDGGAVLVSRRRLGVEESTDPSAKEYGDYSRVVRIDHAGAIVFETDVSVQGEATDIGVDPVDEAFYITSGHCAQCPGQQAKTPPWNGIDGSFSRVEAATGAITWTQFHGNSNPLVGDECWGVAMQADGAVSACGMGVESFTAGPPGCGGKGCCDAAESTWTTNVKEACGPQAQGNFGGSGWRVENLKVSYTDGAQIWRTVDQFNPPGEYVDPIDSWENSASEYVAATADGGIIALTDNDSGMGFLKLNADTGGATTAAPSPVPASGAGGTSGTSPMTPPAGGGGAAATSAAPSPADDGKGTASDTGSTKHATAGDGNKPKDSLNGALRPGITGGTAAMALAASVGVTVAMAAMLPYPEW